MLAKPSRLTKTKDFSKTFKLGKSVYGKLLGVKAIANQQEKNRYGIIISAKVSKKSVVRNKLKRQLRAIIKSCESQLILGQDVAIIVLPKAAESGFAELKIEMARAFFKLKLLK